MTVLRSFSFYQHPLGRIGIFILFTCALSLQTQSFQYPLKGRRIVIDAGHGAINYDGRIVNSGRETKYGAHERKLNVDISLKLGEILKKEGAQVYYTRTYHDYWRQAYGTIEDNKSRALFANELRADMIISVHCDWHPSRKVKGVTTFFAKNDSQKLGYHVHQNMVKHLKARDRKLVKDNFTVLDTATIPAILIETGFLSHRTESKKLNTPAYQIKVAEAITSGIHDYFDQTNKVRYQ